jgi:hypothetical protein
MKWSKPLLMIIIIGALFRLSGVFWGLPYFSDYAGMYHPDELKALNSLLLSLKGLTKISLWGTSSPPSSYNQLIIHVLGRLLSVVLGAGAILITYLLGERLFDKRRALLASFLLCFSMLHVTNSALAMPDVPASFLFVLFMLLLIKTLRQESITLALLSGCALGLLAGTKNNGIFAIIPLLILVGNFINIKHQNFSFLKKALFCLSNNYLWIIVTVAILFFFVASPGITRKFLTSSPRAGIKECLIASSIQSEGFRTVISKTLSFNLDSFSHIAHRLSKSLGMPLALASMLGLFFPLKKRSAVEYSLIIMTIAYLLFFGSALLERYLIMLMPVFALLAGNALVYFSDCKLRLIRICGFCFLLFVCLYSFAYTTAAVYSQYPDTRTEAARYIDQTIPKGASIGIAYTSPRFGWEWGSWHYPKINFTDYRYRDFLQNPDYIILSSYDFKKIKDALQSGMLTSEYVLPERLHRYWYRESPPTPEMFQFYEALWEKVGKDATWKGRSPTDYYFWRHWAEDQTAEGLKCKELPSPSEKTSWSSAVPDDFVTVARNLYSRRIRVRWMYKLTSSDRENKLCCFEVASSVTTAQARNDTKKALTALDFPYPVIARKEIIAGTAKTSTYYVWDSYDSIQERGGAGDGLTGLAVQYYVRAVTEYGSATDWIASPAINFSDAAGEKKRFDYALVKRFEPKANSKLLEFPPPAIEIYGRNK